MKIPPGYEIVVDAKIDRESECLMLVRMIYGLTQAAR